MCQGVVKSGSPMPSEITSFILATISKKSRIPDLGRVDDVAGDKAVGIHGSAVGAGPDGPAAIAGAPGGRALPVDDQGVTVSRPFCSAGMSIR